MTVDHDLWVFGYGSLMWRPGFAFAEARRARLVGYSRRFCIASVHHRGSAERPGLVLGLDRGGVCEGIAYRVPASRAAETLSYLRAREQVNGVYREAKVPVDLHDEPGRAEIATTYLVERAHPSYTGELPLATQVRLISAARGISGVNIDYLVSTLRHLAELGIRERGLERLLTVLGGYFCRPSCGKRRAASALTLQRVAVRTSSRNIQVRRMRPNDRRRFVHRRPR